MRFRNFLFAGLKPADNRRAQFFQCIHDPSHIFDGHVWVDTVLVEQVDAVGPEATLSDVFVHHTGTEMEISGGYRDTARTRRVARRLG